MHAACLCLLAVQRTTTGFAAAEAIKVPSVRKKIKERMWWLAPSGVNLRHGSISCSLAEVCSILSPTFFFSLVSPNDPGERSATDVASSALYFLFSYDEF